MILWVPLLFKLPLPKTNNGKNGFLAIGAHLIGINYARTAQMQVSEPIQT